MRIERNTLGIYTPTRREFLIAAGASILTSCAVVETISGSNDPKTIAKAFIEAYIADDFNKATSLLTPDIQEMIQKDNNTRAGYEAGMIAWRLGDCQKKGTKVKDVFITDAQGGKNANVVLDTDCTIIAINILNMKPTTPTKIHGANLGLRLVNNKYGVSLMIPY